MDAMKNGQIFLSKLFHFQYKYIFLLSREMGNVRICNDVRLQNLTNLDIQHSIRFGIFHVV